MPTQTEIELQAAAFRRLQKHLMEDRTDVQNIDLMNLAGFCRNCLSRWYAEAAAEKGIEIGKDEARELFYGMTMAEWESQLSDRRQARAARGLQRGFCAECRQTNRRVTRDCRSTILRKCLNCPSILHNAD